MSLLLLLLLPQGAAGLSCSQFEQKMKGLEQERKQRMKVCPHLLLMDIFVNTHKNSRWFDQVSLRTHNSSLEGATELKFVRSCSSRDALSNEIFFWP